jgi:hypothetical protein
VHQIRPSVVVWLTECNVSCVRQWPALYSAVLFAAATLACGGSTEQQVTSPDGITRCQMNLAPPPPVAAAGAQFTAALSTTRDCTWTASAAASWLTVAPASGQGDATLTVTVGENPQGRNRSTTININNQQFTVTQNGQPCRFDVAPANIDIPHQGGRLTVNVTTLEGCSWTTQSSQAWLRVVSGSGGDASGAIELTVDSNAGDERAAVLTVAGATVVVNQDAAPGRASCQYSIGPGAQSFTAAGGTGTFKVSTLSNCAWGASSNQPWITVLSARNGSGPTDVQYRVDPNTSASSRSGAITVGTRRHVVQQQGARQP